MAAAWQQQYTSQQIKGMQSLIVSRSSDFSSSDISALVLNSNFSSYIFHLTSTGQYSRHAADFYAVCGEIRKPHTEQHAKPWSLTVNTDSKFPVKIAAAAVNINQCRLQLFQFRCTSSHLVVGESADLRPDTNKHCTDTYIGGNIVQTLYRHKHCTDTSCSLMVIRWIEPLGVPLLPLVVIPDWQYGDVYPSLPMQSLRSLMYLRVFMATTDCSGKEHLLNFFGHITALWHNGQDGIPISVNRNFFELK